MRFCGGSSLRPCVNNAAKRRVSVVEWHLKWNGVRMEFVKKKCQVALGVWIGSKEFAWTAFYLLSYRPISTRGRALDWGELLGMVENNSNDNASEER